MVDDEWSSLTAAIETGMLAASIACVSRQSMACSPAIVIQVMLRKCVFLNILSSSKSQRIFFHMCNAAHRATLQWYFDSSAHSLKADKPNTLPKQMNVFKDDSPERERSKVVITVSNFHRLDLPRSPVRYHEIW